MTAESTSAPQSRARHIVRVLGLSAFTLGTLFFFTVLKLPEDRLKNFIQGTLSAELGAKGISLSSGKSSLSMGLGLSYVMKDVTLQPPPPQSPIRLERVSFSPSILSLILGRIGGSLVIDQGNSHLSCDVSKSNSRYSISYRAQSLDLGKLGLFALAANIKGTALAEGKGSLSFDESNLATLKGNASLNLSKLILEPQTVMGFNIPRIQVSEGKLEATFDNSKGKIQALKLGKPGNPADDIIAQMTGDLTLGRRWESSLLNTKVQFTLSQNILKSFILLDAILGNGKQADGSYAFNLTGPIEAPVSTPVSSR